MAVRHVTDPTTCYCGAMATQVTQILVNRTRVVFGKVWTCAKHHPEKIGINMLMTMEASRD